MADKNNQKELFRVNPWHGVPHWEDEEKKILNTYIEIVPSDRIKYEIDKVSGFLKIDRPQKFSNVLPTLYGFIPQTYSAEKSAEYAIERVGRKGLFGDSDPIDICVLTGRVISHGDILVNCIPIGGLRMLDNGEVDDKVIAVLKDDPIYGEIRDVNDCPKKIIDELKHYFLTYKGIPEEGQKSAVEITEIYGYEESLAVIKFGIEDYQNYFVK